MRVGTAKRKPDQQRAPPPAPIATTGRKSRADVLGVKYLPHLSKAANANKKPFWVWSYEIEIHNSSTEELTIVERHWTIEPIGHAKQQTHGRGIGKGLFVIPPRQSRTYISGVPLPTAAGGAMKGRYVGELASGKRVTIQATVTLPAAAPEPVGRETKAPDWRTFNHKLTAYVTACAKPARAILDAATFGEGARRAFEMFCLGQDGTKGFNARKRGELRTTDIRAALGVPAVSIGKIQHTDMLLAGDSLDDVSVVLIYDSTQDSTLLNSIKHIETEITLCFNPNIMDALTQEYLEKSGLPAHLWGKVAYEISIVKKIAVETDGKATAIRPRSLLPACVLDPEERQRRTQRQTKSTTKWRHKRPEL